MTGKRSNALFLAFFTLLAGTAVMAQDTTKHLVLYRDTDGVAATGQIGRAAPTPFGLQSAEAVSTGDRSDDGENGSGPIIWDVAIDSRTFRRNAGLSPDEFGRGDSFIANGRIFPGGTIPPGNSLNHPDDPGSIGTWVERGTYAAARAEILAGVRPAFFATFFHLLDDGSKLVADGPHPESSPLAVVGGAGRFSGASGELYDEILGRNSTGGVNLRLTIYLKKRAPK